jgi:hypothetical protein
VSGRRVRREPIVSHVLHTNSRASHLNDVMNGSMFPDSEDVKLTGR